MVKFKSPKIKAAQNNKISFGFSNLKPLSYIDAVSDGKFFIRYLDRLSKLSQFEWSEIYTKPRHGYGTESIPITQLNKTAQNNVPEGLISLIILRTDSNNHAFLGFRDGNVFQVLFIEHNFGEIYKH